MLQLGNMSKIGKFIEIFMDNVETDLKLNELMWFASKALKVDLSTMQSSTMPYFDVGMYRGGYYFMANPEEIVPLVNEQFNPYNRDITLDDLQVVMRNKDGSCYVTNGELLDAKWGKAYSGSITSTPSSSMPESDYSDSSDSTTSSETTPPPEEGTTVPPEGEVPETPADGETEIPAEGETGEEVGGEGDVPPAEGTEPPAEETIPPVDGMESLPPAAGTEGETVTPEEPDTNTESTVPSEGDGTEPAGDTSQIPDGLQPNE